MLLDQKRWKKRCEETPGNCDNPNGRNKIKDGPQAVHRHQNQSRQRVYRRPVRGVRRINMSRLGRENFDGNDPRLHFAYSRRRFHEMYMAQFCALRNRIWSTELVGD